MIEKLRLPEKVCYLFTVIYVLLQLQTYALTSTCSDAFLEPEYTTWNGSGWSNNTPDILKNAIISGNYNTASNGSFTASNLIVNAGYTLTVNDNTYIEVENNVDIIGNIIIESKGAFIQNDDSGIFYLDSGAQATVNKTTAVLNRWYDYTYWSAPVAGTTVNQAFAASNVNRRFLFNAQNYLDVLKENANDNTMVAGHDDIDDNGNDWQLLSGTDVLQAGVGYATTHNSTDFEAGNAYQYSFEGSFNTGTIYTPIHYNGDNGDRDWNFIGNPYPSAISADDFFNANSSVVGGVIYLWSHGTPPSTTQNGHDTSNFSSDDYAIINAGSGEVAGGSNVIPNRVIPSGQGFFVQALANGNAVFNNAMRKADNTSNEQFFRAVNNTGSNKLWLNLTTESGLFNQTLIAYVDGATNANDGPNYDAQRNLSTATAAIIYTGIDTDFSTKLAIQGKASNSLNSEEIIPIGFYTSIAEPITYSFSIAKLQGIFFESETVYIKDHLLNITHNLSQEIYTFESETGEFNNRFEIMFRQQTLSVIPPSHQKPLVFSQPNNKQLVIECLSGALINKVQLFDQLGRLVISQQNKQHLHNVDTNQIAAGIYIVSVELSDGQLVTKKIVKRA